MKKFLIIPSFLFLLLFFSAENSYACSCPDDPDSSLKEKVKASYQSATSVFSGEVTGIRQHPTEPNIIVVKLRIDKKWKGVSANEVDVSTANNSASCGITFEIGRKYLVYTYQQNGVLATHLCSRTSEFSITKDLEILNKLKKKKT